MALASVGTLRLRADCENVNKHEFQALAMCISCEFPGNKMEQLFIASNHRKGNFYDEPKIGFKEIFKKIFKNC